MLWIALLLGIVEGLTEFIPVSSTGHLILTSHLLAFGGKRAEIFEIFIQFGAILAVVWEYRVLLMGELTGLANRPESRRFAWHLAIAFLPSAAAGLVLHGVISDNLFTPAGVAPALLAGAAAIFVVEGLPLRARTSSAREVSSSQAVLIGVAQCLALWPGFSRSTATILGGLGVGLDRKAATEFSFFLAIPTLSAASFFDLVTHREWLQPGDLGWLALALGISFFVALLSIRWLLWFVSSHSFRPFAWYRLALGLAVILL